MKRNTKRESGTYSTANRMSLSLPLIAGLIGSSIVISGCASLPLPTRNQVGASNYGVVQTERTIAQRLMDESIANTAKINIRNFNSELNSSRIDVDSFDNEVLLTGEVPSEAAKQNAQNIVTSMSQVKHVYNELKVSLPHTMSYHMHDVYITSKVRSKILASPQLSSSQVKVVTEMGVVYVLGRLTARQQDEMAQIAKTTPGILEMVLLTKLVPG